MKSLFNQQDNQEIINRINSLNPATKALWGKMTVSQMLAHSRAPLLAAYGGKMSKRGLISILFGSSFKKKMVANEEPFKKNLPTDKTFIFTDTLNFEEEKAKLIDAVKAFTEKGAEQITKNEHSFFGNMTPHEWDVIQWKHLDHHLNQFGA